jgi:hypothetical protein
MKHILIAACLTGLLATGCGESSTDPPGNMQVSWSMGIESCQGLGMAVVDVSLIGADGFVYDTQRVACTLKTYLFRNIPAGAYSVQVDGYRANAPTPEYEGFTELINVAPQETALANVPLDRRPGSINVSWGFADGSLCGFAGVDSVRLTIGQLNSPTATVMTYPCDPLAAQAQAEAESPKAQTRDLNGYCLSIGGLSAGGYRVIAQGLRTVAIGQQQVLYATQTELVVLYGQEIGVRLIMDKCDGTQSNVACFQ